MPYTGHLLETYQKDLVLEHNVAQLVVIPIKNFLRLNLFFKWRVSNTGATPVLAGVQQYGIDDPDNPGEIMWATQEDAIPSSVFSVPTPNESDPQDFVNEYNVDVTRIPKYLGIRLLYTDEADKTATIRYMIGDHG